MTVTREDVLNAYRVLLDRLPESDETVEAHIEAASDKAQLAKNIITSDEARLRLCLKVEENHEHHVFKGYDVNDEQVLTKFPPANLEGKAGFITSFLGSRYRTSFVTALSRFDGAVEGYPLPVGSFQGETAEFIGVLRSVLEAQGKYRMLECGAGYGTWMANTYLAAKQRGIVDIHVYGVEGDADHFAFLQRHMIDNSISPVCFTAFNAAIGVDNGVVEWPVPDDAANVYGGRPLENGGDYHGARPHRTVAVRMMALADLLSKEAVWDLLHLDIQGGEGDLCESCIETISQRVRRVFIGTHSRALDGQVMSTFHRAGWSLENEKPTIYAWNDQSPTLENLTTVDGLQVWRNGGL